MPSMQLTLSATTSVPSGFWPRANTSTPQSMQIWCLIACLLKRYSRKLSSPARNWKLFGARKVKCSPFLVQIEQLQAVTMARSLVHSKRTWPQWQPPVKVLLASMVPLPQKRPRCRLFSASLRRRRRDAPIVGVEQSIARQGSASRQLIDPCALSRRKRGRRWRLIGVGGAAGAVGDAGRRAILRRTGWAGRHGRRGRR